MNGPRRLTPDLSAIAAAAASRVTVGVVFVALVSASLSDQEGAHVLQLLFLQGGLTALMSASGYARAAALASADQDMTLVVRRFAVFVIASMVVAGVCGVLLLPPRGAVWDGVVIMFVMGAGAAAMNGLLQGILTVRRGRLTAFAPTVVVNLCTVVVMVLAWNSIGVLGASGLWIATQLGSPLVLWCGWRRWIFGGARRTSSAGGFAAIGILKAGSVGAGYVYRERWAGGQAVESVATGFAIQRITELGYQVIYMLVASAPATFERLFTSRLRTRPFRRGLLGAGVLSSILGIAPAALLNEWEVRLFLLAEVLLVPGRVLTTLSMLALLSLGRTFWYQVTMAVSIVLVVAGAHSAPLAGSPYGLQAYQGLLVLPAVAGVCLAMSRQSRRGL